MSYPGPQDQIKDPEVFREFQEVARAMNDIGQMPVIFREPLKPRDGMFCICSGTTWDPLSDGIKRPVWFDEDSGTWKAF